MKKSLSLFLLGTALLASCKKDNNNNNKPTVPAVLLTKVIDNTPGDANLGKPLAVFTYNVKQLTKAVLYNYYSNVGDPDIETNLFNYDTQGHLTGTTIAHTVLNSYNDVSSTVIYNGNDISEIKFYTAGNVLDKDIKLTYQNGNLANWYNSNEVNDTYTYDTNGNNTKETAVEYQDGKPDGFQSVTTNATFDSKSNLSLAVPFWAYFRVADEDQWFAYTPGKNNPLTSNDAATNFTYSYQYNTYGFPSAISWTDQYPQAYQYEYVQVN